MSSSIIPRPTFRDLDSIRSQVNAIFNELSDGQRPDMPIDVSETEQEVVVKASVPGIKPEELSVTIDHGVLAIKGEHKEEHEETQGTWHIHERRAGSVYRAITLPSTVDEAKVEARLQDGVLEVHLPKSEKAAPRSITVQTT